MSQNDTFLFHVQSGAIVRDIQHATDKTRSVLTLAGAAKVPADLPPDRAASQFVESFYDRHCLPEWAASASRRRRGEPAVEGLEDAVVVRRAVEMYDKFAPILNALILRIAGDAALAESILIDVVADAARSASPGRRSLAGLAGCARAAALPHARPGFDGDGSAPESPLQSLGPRQRMVLERVFFEGRQPEELAEDLDAPRTWVGAAICRGLETLMQPSAKEPQSV